MLRQISANCYGFPCDKKIGAASIGYIRHGNHAIMVDTGGTPKRAEIFLQELQQEKLPIPQYAILTHSHWDHSFGMMGLSIPIVACENTVRHIQILQQQKWDSDGRKASVAKGIIPPIAARDIGRQFPEETAIQLRLPEKVFPNNSTIHFEDVLCQAVHVPSAHDDDTVVVFAREDGILFTGDAIYQELCGETWIERPEKVAALAECLEEIPFHHAVISHSKYPIPREELLIRLRKRGER